MSDDSQAPICPRCGPGRPSCTDLKPDGTRYTHAETCATYLWADDVCGPCEDAMATFNEGVRTAIIDMSGTTGTPLRFLLPTEDVDLP